MHQGPSRERARRREGLVDRVGQIHFGKQRAVSALPGGGMHRGRCKRLELRIVRLHVPLLALPIAQERVAADREEPSAALGSERVAMPCVIRPEKGLLDQIVGVGLVPRER